MQFTICPLSIRLRFDPLCLCERRYNDRTWPEFRGCARPWRGVSLVVQTRALHHPRDHVWHHWGRGLCLDPKVSKGQSPYVWCLVVSVPIILLVDCNHWPLLKATLSLCQCRSVPKRLELVWAWCTKLQPSWGFLWRVYNCYTGVNLR